MNSQGRNPFPGLRPFEPGEASHFFGRSRHVDEVVRRLRDSRFVAVLGGSGSGKSSLVRAGVVPALLGGHMVGVGSGWRTVILRPGNDPFRILASKLDRFEILGGGEHDVDSSLRLEVTLRSSAGGLVEAVRLARLPPSSNVLVVVDRFEELFRFKRRDGSGTDEAMAFVKLLIAAAQAPDVRVYVVLTLRADYFGHCAEFPDLPEAINAGQYLLPRMTRDESREAIEGPLRLEGTPIEPQLVTLLLNEVHGDPAKLPILQHALMRTWDFWARQDREAGKPIGVEHYHAVGTMRHAVSLHADEAFHDALYRARAIAATNLIGSRCGGTAKPEPGPKAGTSATVESAWCTPGSAGWRAAIRRVVEAKIRHESEVDREIHEAIRAGMGEVLGKDDQPSITRKLATLIAVEIRKKIAASSKLSPELQRRIHRALLSLARRATRDARRQEKQIRRLVKRVRDTAPADRLTRLKHCVRRSWVFWPRDHDPELRLAILRLDDHLFRNAVERERETLSRLAQREAEHGVPEAGKEGTPPEGELDRESRAVTRAIRRSFDPVLNIERAIHRGFTEGPPNRSKRSNGLLIRGWRVLVRRWRRWTRVGAGVSAAVRREAIMVGRQALIEEKQISPAAKRCVQSIRQNVLDRVERETSERAREVARRLFQSLTDTHENRLGVRRPVTVEEASAILPASAEEIYPIVESFRAEHCNVLTTWDPRSIDRPIDSVSRSTSLTPRTIVDITHESLIWRWERLAGWARLERERAELYLDLTRAEALHAEGHGGLMSGVALRRTRRWWRRDRPNRAWALLYAWPRDDRTYERARDFFAASMRAWNWRRFVTVALPLVLGGVLVAYSMWWLWEKYGACDPVECAEECQDLKCRLDARSAADLARRIPDPRVAAGVAVECLRLAEACGGDTKWCYASLWQQTRRFDAFGSVLDVPSCDDPKAASSRSVIRAVAAGPSAGGNVLAAGSADGRVLLFYRDGSEREPSELSPADPHGVQALAFDATRQILAAGRTDGSVWSWNLKTEPFGPPRRVRAADGTAITALAFKGTGRLATGGSAVELWRIAPDGQADRESALSVRSGNAVTALAFAPLGDVLAVGTNPIPGYDPKPEPEGVILWNPETPARGRLLENGRVTALAFAPDGRLATGLEDGTIDIRAWKSGTPTTDPPAPRLLFSSGPAAVSSLSFAPGAPDVLVSTGRSVQLWDLETSPPVSVELDEHRDWVHAVAFDPGGEEFYTGSEDETVRVWKTHSESLVRELCRKVPLNDIDLDAVLPDAGIDWSNAPACPDFR